MASNDEPEKDAERKAARRKLLRLLAEKDPLVARNHDLVKEICDLLRAAGLSDEEFERIRSETLEKLRRRTEALREQGLTEDEIDRVLETEDEIDRIVEQEDRDEE